MALGVSVVWGGGGQGKVLVRQNDSCPCSEAQPKAPDAFHLKSSYHFYV